MRWLPARVARHPRHAPCCPGAAVPAAAPTPPHSPAPRRPPATQPRALANLSWLDARRQVTCLSPNFSGWTAVGAVVSAGWEGARSLGWRRAPRRAVPTLLPATQRATTREQDEAKKNQEKPNGASP